MRAGRIGGALATRVLVRTFGLWERLGLHVTRNHFYDAIPDTRKLPEELWTRRSPLRGIDMREERQLELLESWARRLKGEYERFPRKPTSVPHEYYVQNGVFGSVDGEVLYCAIRHFRPRRIVEVGSGNSTYLAAQALAANQTEAGGPAATLVSIDPHANPVVARGFPGLTRLEARPVQEVPLAEFTRLERDDLLLIDSSHVAKVGSDVNYVYLEILPALADGVVVHVHDVFLPAEYPQEWIRSRRRFWNEQYLLQAFVAFNDRFEVIWAGSYMHLEHPERLRAAFESYEPGQTHPGSFYLRARERAERASRG